MGNLSLDDSICF